MLFSVVYGLLSAHMSTGLFGPIARNVKEDWQNGSASGHPSNSTLPLASHLQAPKSIRELFFLVGFLFLDLTQSRQVKPRFHLLPQPIGQNIERQRI